MGGGHARKASEVKAIHRLALMWRARNDESPR
jgi:hypothetical protein